MAAKLSRKDLKPMVLYFVQDCEQYFWSPDGEGGYWYDTKTEAIEDVGLEDNAPVTIIGELLDY